MNRQAEREQAITAFLAAINEYRIAAEVVEVGYPREAVGWVPPMTGVASLYEAMLRREEADDA